MISSLGFSQSLPIDFSDPLDYNFKGVGGSTFSADNSPTDNTNPVVKIIGGTDTWNSRIDLKLAVYIDMTTASKTFTFDFYSTEAVVMNGLFQINNEENSGFPIEMPFVTNGSIGWQTITLDFANAKNGYPNGGDPVVYGQYAGLSVFTNFGDNGTSTYYVDNIAGAANGLAVPTEPMPLVAADPPITRKARDVISLFSNSYTNTTVDNWSADWDNSDITDVQIQGNDTKKIIFTGYLGVDFSGAGHHLNTSSMEYFHVDFWTSNANLVGKVINFNLSQWGGGPAQVKSLELHLDTGTIPAIVSGSWVSVDVPISRFTNYLTRDDIAQLVITSNLGTVYVDNIYFWRTETPDGTPTIGALSVPAKILGDAPFDLVDPVSDSQGAFTYTSSDPLVAEITGKTVTIVGGGTTLITANQAADGTFLAGSVSANLVVTVVPLEAAPPVPLRDAVDVVSIYSNAYTNVALSELPTSWSELGSGGLSQIQIAGNDTWKMTTCEFLGMVSNYGTGIDLSKMEKMHIDYWTPDPNEISVKIVNTVDGGYAIASLGATVTGSWQSLDIDMSAFANLSNKSKITQLLIDPSSPSILYIDNFYFWKDPTPAGTPVIGELILPTKNFGDAPFDLTDPTSNSLGAFSYTSSNPLVAVITDKTVTIVGAGTTIITANQAADGDYIAGSVTANFVVTALPSESAPPPPLRNETDVISLFSDAYTNVASNFDAGWCGDSSVKQVLIAGNPTAAFKNNDCQGIVLDAGIDASSFTNVHVDIYIQAGTNLTSSVFNLKFVQKPGNGVLEVNLNVASTPALVAGSWLQVDIPVDLTTFTGFKEFAISSNLKNIVWYDNLYVYKAPSMATEKFATAAVKMYPNPATNNLTIEANDAIEQVALYNMLGQEVVSKTTNNKVVTLDISSLQNGIYIVKTTIKGVTSASRVIKN